jgi:hypothetical protein
VYVFIEMNEIGMIKEKGNLVIRYPGQCIRPVSARWYHEGPSIKSQEEQTAQGTASSRHCRLEYSIYRKSRESGTEI